MDHVFTYGSLMYEQIWNLVVAGVYEKSTATISGYTRRAVRGEDYPALLGQAGAAATDGILYFNVSAADLCRLDEFEGRYYRRKQEPVVVENGSTFTAEVYVFKDRYRHLVSETEWDPAQFETAGIDRFIENYTGFQRSR